MATKPKTIEQLRAARDLLNAEIEERKIKARSITAEIVALEGPIGDRSGRKETAFTLKPAAPKA
jgi:hypothetical protein